MYKGKRVFMLGTHNGNLVVYDRQGKYEKTIEIGGGAIVQMIKSSANLYVRSSEGITWIGLASDKLLTKCELPNEDPVQLLSSNDHGTNKFYVRTKSHVFVYEVATSCKPKRVLDIPSNSTVHILSDSVLAYNNLSAIVFNSSLGYKSSWTSLRKPTLHGDSYNISVFKKSEGVFGVAYISYNYTNNQTELSLYQYQLHDESLGESFSLKGFKAPIFVITIGAVFYYSFVMKKKKPIADHSDGDTAAD